MAVNEELTRKEAGKDDQGEGLSVYYHTHWDREWYMPFRAYQVRLAEVVDEVLERLETDALPCFMLDGQTVVLEDYLELRPENRPRLQKLIDDGRLSIGPWYVAPDEFLISGESLIRNLMRGIRQSREWGCNRFTGYLPDTFGHSADMPTILRGFGIDSAILWRGLNPKHSILNWQSPSGATVRVLHLTDGYFQMMLDDWTATPDERVQALETLVQKLRNASPDGKIGLLPMGADHLGPLPKEGRDVLLSRYPKLNETTPDRFMGNLNGISPLETVQGELMDNSSAFLLPGVWSSRMYLKQANRRLEHRLIHRLEPLLAMAQGLLHTPPRYPVHELDLAWKTLILNHPHDSICGCSVDEVHRENEVRFENVRQITDALEIRAEQSLAQLGTEDEWVIFNAGDTPYTGLVSAVENLPSFMAASNLTDQVEHKEVLQDDYLFDPHRIPLSHMVKQEARGSIWVENIPPHSVKVISKSIKPKFQPVQGEQHRIENEYFAITAESDESFIILDKRTGREYDDFFQLQVFVDNGDSYNSDPESGAEGIIAAKIGDLPASVFPAKGHLCAHFGMPGYVDEKLKDVQFSVLLTLYAGSPYIHFLVNTRPHYSIPLKLQVVFTTGETIRKVSAESHLGVVQREYTPDYRLQNQSPAEKMKEHKTNTGPIQRFISTNGHTWITEGLTEYEVYQDTLALTLSRGFSLLSSKKLNSRGAPAGPPYTVPEGNNLFRKWECFNFAWMPTPDDPAKLWEAAGRFYGNVWAVTGARQDEIQTPQANLSLVHWNQPALVSSACYWLPGKGLILRLVNLSDKEVSTGLTAGFEYQTLHEVNFLEEVQGALQANHVTIGAKDVKTLLFTV